MEFNQKTLDRLKKIDTYTLKELEHQMLIDEEKFQKDLKEISYELKRRENKKQDKKN
jgi:hypothetical protein